MTKTYNARSCRRSRIWGADISLWCRESCRLPY